MDSTNNRTTNPSSKNKTNSSTYPSTNTDISMVAVVDSTSQTPREFSSYQDSPIIDSYASTDLSSYENSYEDTDISTTAVVDSKEKAHHEFWTHLKAQEEVSVEKRCEKVHSGGEDDRTCSNTKAIGKCEEVHINEEDYEKTYKNTKSMEKFEDDENEDADKTYDPKFMETSTRFWKELLQKIEENQKERQGGELWKEIAEQLEVHFKSVQR